MRLIDNPKRTAIAVVCFLLLAFAYRACSAEEAFLELGPTLTDGFNGGAGLVYTERFIDRFDVGLHLVSDQEWDGRSIGNNGGLTGAFVFERPDRFWRWLPDELHLGAAVWIHTDDRLIGCHLGYSLGLRYYVGERFLAGLRHWSNSGTCSPNRGQDLAVFGVRF